MQNARYNCSPKNWSARAISWPEERSEAFAGTHAEHVLVLFDEAGAIADVIWDVTEGAMTAGECVWLAFGNAARNTGRFRECCRKFRHRWTTRRVDARHAKKANKAQIEQWVADYGEDSDLVRIRVRGVFPRAGSVQFIAEDLVFEARRRVPEGYERQPIIMGVNVARYGEDQSVILLRQGTAVLHVKRYRDLDTMQFGARVAEAIETHKPSAVFIDGVGVGGGAVDRLKGLSYDVLDVNDGGRAARPDD